MLLWFINQHNTSTLSEWQEQGDVARRNEERRDISRRAFIFIGARLVRPLQIETKLT